MEMERIKNLVNEHVLNQLFSTCWSFFRADDYQSACWPQAERKKQTKYASNSHMHNNNTGSVK